MNTPHTPTPWLTDGKEIFTGDAQLIARLDETGPIGGNPFARAHNAAYIVRACNAHDDLMAAATAARKQLKLWMKDHGHDSASQEAIAAINAALTKAGAL